MFWKVLPYCKLARISAILNQIYVSRVALLFVVFDSIIGRDCPLEKREEYYAWDNINREREKICDYIMREFPDIEASIGGQISIDMHHLGLNKAQVLDDIPGKIYFFGDRMDQAGNDYPIAKRLQASGREYRLFKVKNPKDTWEILQNL